jgi:putative ABC transport system ATP-binding protein
MEVLMEILRTENLIKTYGNNENKFNAVDDISLSVEQGEFVAIVGASGSGKSTLLHMIGGVDRPTSGKIIIDGKEINSMNNDNIAIFRRRQIGIVYQFYNLIPILTVEENITLPCDLDGSKVDKDRLYDIMNTLGIADKRNSLPNELSGGQQQRTSIARGLINNPALLLADEPTGNLDSKATEDIMSILKMTNRNYKQTILMITHNMELAKEADRIITIQDGKILREV